MIQQCSYIDIVDKTSSVKGYCIKVLKGKSFANIGNTFMLSIRIRNAKKAKFMKIRLQKKFAQGSIHRALLIRSKTNYARFPGLFLKFFDNACALVNRRIVPISNRIYGPVLKELCMIWPSIGCVSKDIF